MLLARRREIVCSQGFCHVNDVLCHEEVVADRLEKFVDYLRTLEPNIILPSIIVCEETNTLIDGHHRYHALIALGYEWCPVTYIDYSHASIVPHLSSAITKKDIVDAALKKQLLSPKSSCHHLIDNKGMLRPIILLSSLSDMM
jgi:hypothetical protein